MKTNFYINQYFVEEPTDSVYLTEEGSSLTEQTNRNVNDLSTLRRWYSGEHSCLPSSWPGFDSRSTHIVFLFF